MCLFAPFLISAQSQSSSAQLLDLELEIYQSRSLDESAKLLLRKSEIWLGEFKYPKALKALERINSYAINDSLKNELAEMKALCYYLSADYAFGKNAILEASIESWYNPSADLKLTEILIEIELGNFEAAENLVMLWKPELGTEQVFDVRKLKKEERAFNLSLIFPGSGQLYAGHFFKGFSSMALQTACLYFGITGLQDRYFFSQAVPGIAGFQGFYFGGANYAKELVADRNQKIKTQLSTDILDLLK